MVTPASNITNYLSTGLQGGGAPADRGLALLPADRGRHDRGRAGRGAAAGASVDLVEVPGALEIPTAIGLVTGRNLYDGYVALGCVIRGETTHYDTVCNDSSRGLTLLGLQGHCIGNGILTVENTDQAVVRSDPKGQNKGGGAAAAALHLIALKRGWARKTSRRPRGRAT